MTTSHHVALAKAIERLKTQAGLAEAVGTTQSLVGYWLNKSKRGVPAEWVLRVEAASGVSRHELRPDLYPVAETRALNGAAA